MSDLMLCLKCNGYSVYKNKCTCKDKQIKQLQKDKAELEKVVSRAIKEMSHAAEYDFMGDEYHETILELKAINSTGEE